MASKEIIDLTGDSDDEKRPAKKQKTDEPRWKGKTGTARMMSEFRSLRREWGDSPKLLSLETVDDQMNLWRLKVNDFDNDSAGGRQLNADLEKLRSRSHNFIELEISFPADYPTSPFFLRLIAPRMMWYTGHVTAGGAICIEALTNSGTPHSWSADLSVETILRTVFNNMCHAEIGHVRTVNGGGRTGPLRVDLDHHYSPDVLTPYSIMEAKAAFSRMLDHHKRNGW